MVIWVLAEQDRREIEALASRHQDDNVLYNKIKGLLDDLDVVAQRYSRGLGGISLAELSYSPEHAIEIARYRVLKTVERVELTKVQDEYIVWLGDIVRRLNLTEVFTRYKEELKRYYPFSLGLINLLKKLMCVRDVPATEFVRTVIMVASGAARRALEGDPEGAYAIGVKHLTVPGVVLAKLMCEFADDWATATGDIELALSKMDSDKREAAEIAAKYILAKGVTVNILGLETGDKRDLDRYGSTIEEIQLEILESFIETKALQVIEKLGEALEKLRAESARIDEKEVEGRRYYLPSLLRTIYHKLASYILEERKNLDNKTLIPVYIRQTSVISSLFTRFASVRISVNRRSDDVSILLTEYRKVRDVDALLSDPAFQEAQSKGKLLLIVVPPWDIDLFRELYLFNKSYEEIISDLVERLQNIVEQGKIRRPLHIVILLPDLTETRINRVLEKLVVYEGTKKFLDYLSKEENIIYERLREYENIFVKRRDIMQFLSEDIRRKHWQELKRKLEYEISEARNSAQSQLVRLSREIVIDVLGLYRKVVYYSIDANRFTAKDIIVGEAAKEATESIKIDNLLDYAPVVNKFFAEMIRGLAYETNPMKILRVLLEFYQREFQQGVTREYDRIHEVLENIMLGTYGIKPLSLSVASEAVESLNNQKLEFDDKIITIVVDKSAGLIRFNVKVKKTAEKTTGEEVREVPAIEPTRAAFVPVTATRLPIPEQTIQHVPLELPPGFNVDDIRSRLIALMNLLDKLGVAITSIEFKLESTNISLSFKLRSLTTETLSDTNVKAIINLLSRVSGKESKGVSVDIHLSEPVAEDNIRKVFGEYLSRRSSFDKFLPT